MHLDLHDQRAPTEKELVVRTQYITHIHPEPFFSHCGLFLQISHLMSLYIADSKVKKDVPVWFISVCPCVKTAWPLGRPMGMNIMILRRQAGPIRGWIHFVIGSSLELAQIPLDLYYLVQTGELWSASWLKQNMYGVFYSNSNITNDTHMQYSTVRNDGCKQGTACWRASID